MSEASLKALNPLNICQWMREESLLTQSSHSHSSLKSDSILRLQLTSPPNWWPEAILMGRKMLGTAGARTEKGYLSHLDLITLV